MTGHNESRAELVRAPQRRRLVADTDTELADFCRWLCDTARIPNDPFEVVEKPWKWESEHQEWMRFTELDALADAFGGDDDRYAA
jgi:hypothetical protein